MGKICERLLNFVQIYDHEGAVRLCAWLEDCRIGSLSCQNMKEIYHGEPANRLRKKLMNGDYSLCNIDACPYLAMGDIENHMVEIDAIPEYPEELYLAYENVCNYHCISCTVPETMVKNKMEDLKNGYDKIEEELKEVLPYVKKLGANGCGELFVSKRILKLLSEWKPLAPAEEISVSLETNGSLFDEEHWKQIENLGQYHLDVAVTVMSFDEQTYQLLSGTKLPISKIEDNLRFVKKLREQGIINYFEIATVVQERNFRTVPEFARRCVEEFGADYLRLRPYSPWGSQAPEIEWFMDIRNPQHPYYSEYKEMKRDKIFQHPRVHDWSGGLDTVCRREFPYKLSHVKEQILTELITNTESIVENLRHNLNEKQIVIYGLGNIGKSLVKILCGQGMKPVYILDKYKQCNQFQEIDVHSLQDTSGLTKQVDIIITPLLGVKNIITDLKILGYEGNLILLETIIEDFISP
ncbi:MAG: radical SAM protein [Lachnospiraceae bacterium]|nr:radical SAM protein [Lachnospiraceae bacterium]